IEEIAARFRKGEKKGGAGPAPQTRRPADSSAGAQGQVPHDG
ncbi:pilus assembly protein, partial [Pseudomonas sp. BGM005]|nr:pilus assembly protein [Pseudomonas sp. BG5]